MPRPQRDYNVALRQDIEKIDRKIEALLIERERKSRMLAVLNQPVHVKLAEFLESRASRPLAKKRRAR